MISDEENIKRGFASLTDAQDADTRRFFTRYEKQAGTLPLFVCRPLAPFGGGMTASAWTRVPFCEMWGKPKGCRTSQEHPLLKL